MLIYIKVRELTECTLLTNCVKIELPGDSRGLQKPDRKTEGMQGAEAGREIPLKMYRGG